jgi:hypothetical protein
VAAERDAIARLPPLGVRMMADWEGGGTRMDLAESSLSPLVRVLMTDGWRIEAEGRVYRSPTASTLDVRSGIDWFELHGRIDFGGVTAELPALLAAVRRRERFVRLSDGSMGLLPEEWLANTNRLAAIGSVETDHLRFAKAQAPLLDAWLATQPAVSCDEAFATARRALAEFERVQPVEPPRSFRGVLRPYQRDALAWFGFLRQFGFGGCLADEMGLGKTVMVLAALDARRLERERAGQKPHPSLIVVPRSVVFNWRLEASRFAPKLRVLDYTGSGRRDLRDRIDAFDIVLTTYGTLRLDIGDLKAIAFDYAILDEAQAIKNADTASAKAARLLQANHRLALSGTPVENHLGELWSLFEFLNPGALGSAWPAPPAAAAATTECSTSSRGPCGRSSCAERRSRWRAICRRGRNRRSTAISSRRSARFTTSCATTIARRCLGGSSAMASADRSCRFSRPCSGCARPPAIPASSIGIEPARRPPSSTCSCRGCRSSSKTAARSSSSRSSRRCWDSCVRGSTTSVCATSTWMGGRAIARRGCSAFRRPTARCSSLASRPAASA